MTSEGEVELVERMAAQRPDGARWRVGAARGICHHAVSSDGQRVVLGGRDGSFYVLDRDGVLRYDEALWQDAASRDRLSLVACSAQGRRSFAGTWSGRLYAYDEEGFQWKADLRGVCSALATSERNDTIVVGTWAGRVHVLDGAGEPIGFAALDDAVAHLAAPRRPAPAPAAAGGMPILAALVNGDVVGLDPDGTERWRRRLRSRVIALRTWTHDAVVAVADGRIEWLDARGEPIGPAVKAGDRLTHLAVAESGALVASIDGANRLVIWARDDAERGRPAPVLKERVSRQLDVRPEALAVAQMGQSVACLVTFPTGQILAFSRAGQRKHIVDLPFRPRSMSFSSSGVHATGVSSEGDLVFVELTTLTNWLAGAKLRAEVQAGPFSQGKYTEVCISIRNDGARSARNIEIRLESDLVRVATAASETVAVLEPQKLHEMRRSLQPIHSGDVPLAVVLRYRDDTGAELSETVHETLRVGAGDGGRDAHD